jgi:hypothetical protein
MLNSDMCRSSPMKVDALIPILLIRATILTTLHRHEWLALLLCIRNVRSSNFGLRNGHTHEDFLWLSSTPLGRCKVSNLL